MKRLGLGGAILLGSMLGMQVAQATVRMPAVFSDGMVLQQQASVAIWGQSDKSRVSVLTTWDGKTYVADVDPSGSWRMKVATPSYGGPYEIEVSDGDALRIRNVMVGEVWVCSGQSNMDMRVGGRYNEPVLGSLDDIVTSANPDIRMFTVGSKMTSEPQSDCIGTWQEAASETVPGFSAAGYYFARKLNQVLKVPVGIIHASYGGSRVEAWMSREAVAPFKGDTLVRNACILYNGMLNPVVGYGIRGCLWYQGEANVDAPDLYTRLFPAMVADWRAKWGMGEFPFYYAQIAPNHYSPIEEKGNSSAYQREAQLKCLELIPSSGMVVLTDLGDAHTIHPMEKRTVGNRFAYMALGLTYGMKGFPVTGPLYRSMKVEEGRAIISFDHTGAGLTSYHKPLTGFEVAGADRVFHPAEVRLGRDAQTVIVSSREVEKPVAVRYAFKDYTEGSLFNLSGLPASSFRTDDW